MQLLQIPLSFCGPSDLHPLELLAVLIAETAFPFPSTEFLQYLVLLSTASFPNCCTSCLVLFKAPSVSLLPNVESAALLFDLVAVMQSDSVAASRQQCAAARCRNVEGCWSHLWMKFSEVLL